MWPAELQQTKQNHDTFVKTKPSRILIVKEYTSFFDQVNLDTAT
jgi:hypothetical protein